MKISLHQFIKIFVCLLALTVLPGCFLTNTNTENSSEKKQSTTEQNSDGQNDERWESTFDSDLGLTFSYPQSFQTSTEILNYNDASKYDPKHFQGKEKRIHLKSALGDITIYAYTKDLRHFYGEKFVGGDLGEVCRKYMEPNEWVVQTCKILSYKNMQYIFSNEFSAPECSPYFSSKFSFNNPDINSEYVGIVLSTDLIGINKEVYDNYFTSPGCKPPKEFYPFIKNRVFEVLNEQNLSKQDESMLMIMKSILQSVSVPKSAS